MTQALGDKHPEGRIRPAWAAAGAVRGMGGGEAASSIRRFLVSCAFALERRSSQVLSLCLDSPSDVDGYIFCGMGNSRVVEMSKGGEGMQGAEKGGEIHSL